MQKGPVSQLVIHKVQSCEKKKKKNNKRPANDGYSIMTSEMFMETTENDNIGPD